MNKNTVITISREYGSGGRFIGRIVSQKLGIKLYDKELLELVANDSGYSKEYLDTLDEKPSDRFLSAIASNLGSSFSGLPISEQIMLKTFGAIRALAESESCVIIGRCSDYVLRDYDNVINIFIYSSMENRVRKVVDYYNVDEKDVKKIINRIDKQRATYYEQNTDRSWGDVHNYDLAIDSSLLGAEKTAELIIELYKTFQDK